MLATFSFAQEGHPMSGSWVGDWGTSASNRHRVVLVLEWSGSEVTGVVNPGANAIPIKSSSVDPMKWSLHFVAEGRDPSGAAVTYEAEGTIDDLGTYNRTLSGTWKVNGQTGDFSITRQ
jgi:hypothetical protein